MLLHLSFWARAEKMKFTDPTPTITVAFLDLHKNFEQIGAEEIQIAHSDWQMHYVVIDLKTEHIGHSVREESGCQCARVCERWWCGARPCVGSVENARVLKMRLHLATRGRPSIPSCPGG